MPSLASSAWCTKISLSSLLSTITPQKHQNNAPCLVSNETINPGSKQDQIDAVASHLNPK